MGDWRYRTIKLKPNHGWRKSEGFKLVSVGYGDLLFECPEDWVQVLTSHSIKHYDRKPPRDNATLEVSLLPVPVPVGGGLHVPLLPVFLDTAARVGRPFKAEEAIRIERPGMEILWREYSGIDPKEKRKAIYRSCLARGNGRHAVISFAFWPEHRNRFSPVWDHVMDSLQMGVEIKDLSVGPILH